MRQVARHPGIWRALLLAATLVFAYAHAGPLANETAGSRVPKPVLAVAKGDKCIADSAFMRRNHMKLLLHRRDETVHAGIRGEGASLAGCVECHANGTPRSVVGSDEHFCQGCHSYAAVKLDCFTCHAATPREAALPKPRQEPVVGATR